MKIYLLLAIISLSLNSFGQGERKLSKNFTFVVSGKIDTVGSFRIMQRVKHSGWGEFYGAMSQALLADGFRVINGDYPAPNAYIIVIDYDRGFFAGKMQYIDLRGQILTPNGIETVGSFRYEGRFNPGEITIAIAAKLKEIKPFIVK